MKPAFLLGVAFLATLVFLLGTAAAAAAAAPPRCPYPPNTIPIFDTDVFKPQLVNTLKNGKLFVAGNSSSNDTFYVQMLYCDDSAATVEDCAYQMGLASGSLNKKIIPVGIANLYAWIKSQAVQKVPWLPPALVKIIAEFGAAFALDLQWNVTAPFTHARFVREMQGIADGAGVTFGSIARINMLAELIKAECSIILANNDATANSVGGHPVHLRSLDGMDGDHLPAKDIASFTVYHYPSRFSKPKVANIGFIGFIGTFTGIGENLTLGEKAWNAGQPFNIAAGEAWTFVSRRMLEARTLAEAKQTLMQANRTCSVHLAQCSRTENACQLTESSGGTVMVLDENTFQYPQHPHIKDVQYLDKFAQPTSSFCFRDVLLNSYGKLTAEYLALSAAAALGSGDLHAATFDLKNQIAYFSTARKTYSTAGALKACHRQWTRLDMAKLFAEPSP